MRGTAVRLPEDQPSGESKVGVFSVRSHWLTGPDCRLDATFHAEDAVAARRVIEGSGFEVKALGECVAEIFMPALTVKIPFGDQNSGVPYLTQSELFMFRPTPRKYVIARKLDNPERWSVKAGWLVMSQSGTIGIVGMVTKRVEPFVISPNPIRLVPRDDVPAGYIYALLSTRFAQALVKRSQYGVSVDHILPQHLSPLPVPLLPHATQHALHDQILIAYLLRDEANALLDQADELLHSQLALPRFHESQVGYLSGDKLKAFVLKASEFAERFDASFHLPVAKTCVTQMEKGKYALVRLGVVAKPYVAPRFRRIYVAPEHGVPFLQGSHIPLMKPHGLKYLSRRAHADLSPWLIRKGWVLVTCSGVVGRVALAATALDGWAASQHIERIIPTPGRCHPGYLAAFLMTAYGQHQLTSKIYGGVVDELTEEDTAAILVPDAPMPVQERIGALVMDAFEKKEEANKLEEAAVRQLEGLIAPPRAISSDVSHD